MSNASARPSAIVLTGCAPVPLASYLTALGTFRVVVEQSDTEARACWDDDRFHLHTRLDRAALEELLLERYRPAPIVAPWNGGSGFYPKDKQTGIQPLSVSNVPRFADLRSAIDLGFDLVEELELDESPKDRAVKRTMLARYRARAPERALPWIDAAVVLTGEDPKYPPLLGTGGNDGRLDFTNNFMQRLVALFEPETGKPRPEAAVWLRGALFGEPIPSLPNDAIGQFAPGAAGGPNASTGFGGDARVNPWDFVLMLEGALLFAGAVTRRLESSARAALSFPFTVRALGAGSASAALSDEGDARGEIWLPLWSRPVGLDELETLFAEGRATVHRRVARDGLDFARAVAGLGVDRGIDAFERYSFLMRSGRAYLATSLGRVRVTRNPEADLIDELEKNDYLASLRRFARREEAPARVRSLAGALDRALFGLATHGGRARVQEVISLVGELQRAIGVSPTARHALRPVPFLSQRWVEQADDASHEFRLAAALAGLYAPDLPMWVHLVPLSGKKGPRRWTSETRLVVWADGPLVPNLARVLERRLLETRSRDGISKPFAGGPPADLAAIAAFLEGRTDDRRIGRLLGGLAFVRQPRRLSERPDQIADVPAAYAVLKPLTVDEGALREQGLLSSERPLPFTEEIVRKLSAGNEVTAGKAVQLAWRRLRIAGVELPRHPDTAPGLGGLDGRRLAAALLVPIDGGALRSLFSRITQPRGDRPAERTV